MKSVLKRIVLVSAIALIALAGILVSCEPPATPVTIPEGYEIMYFDTSLCSATPQRLHVHTWNVLANDLIIEEIFAASAMEYTAGRTIIQDWETPEGGDLSWGATWDIGGSSTTANPGALTLTTTTATGEVYSGNVGSAGFDAAYIGFVVDSVGIAAIRAAFVAGAGAEGSELFEYQDGSGVVRASDDIGDISIYVPAP